MNDSMARQRPAQEEAEFSLRDFLGVARRRWGIILVAFVPLLGGAIGLSLVTPPVYRASTTVTTDKAPPVVLPDKTGEFVFFVDQAAAQAPAAFTLAELVKSETVKDGAIARLMPTLGAEGARAALSGVSVQPVRDTELVRINVEHTERIVAAAAANAVAESLVDMNLKARRRRATNTRQFIEKQLALAAQKLRTSEAAVVAYKSSNGDISLAEETTLRLQRLAELGAKRVELRLPRQEVQALVATLQSQLAALQIELSGVRRQFTLKHPAVISTEAKIAETERRLQGELARTRQTEQSRERALTTTIEQYEVQLHKVPTREAELARLTRNTKEAEEIYLLLSTKLHQALVAEASIGSAIQIVDLAKVPEMPAKTRARKTMLLGAIFGLVLGTAGALLMEHLDDTVKSADEVEGMLGTRVLGVVPLVESVNTRGNGGPRRISLPLLINLDRSSPTTEAYRALRTHVLSAMRGAGHRCLLVTSPLPREGKSTVAVNLSLMLGRAHRRAWLVDCDLRHSTLGGLFPQAATLGPAAFLQGHVQIDEVVRPTDQPDLWILTDGGSPVANAAELLGNERMARLIGEARTLADVVLIDSPAVLPTTDAEILGTHVDGALMVVKVGKTTRHALVEACHRLERAGVPVVGAVLNFVPARRRRDYYDPQYHVYYGQDADGEERKAPARSL